MTLLELCKGGVQGRRHEGIAPAALLPPSHRRRTGTASAFNAHSWQRLLPPCGGDAYVLPGQG